MDGAIEHFSVGGPAGVVDGDFVLGFGFYGAGAFFEDFGGEAGSGFFGIGGGGFDVWRGLGHGWVW